jgi:hypothetical protein
MAQRLRRRLRHRYLGILPMLVAIGGCSITDRFSPRAVQYNQEAANAKISAILANIVRASNFMPLQFTEYTQVVGQLYAGGNLAGTLPVFPGPGSVPRIYELSPTVSANAQTNVTVQNLNSQEFYNGLQSQVSQPMLANFLAIGFDPDVVFMLLVSSLRSKRDGKIVELRNDPDTAAQFKAFYDAGKMLRLSGFTFETSAGAEKFIGPQLTEAEAKTLMSSYIAALGVAAASGNASALPDLSKNRAGRFQFSKTSATFRICFDESKLRRFARCKSGSVGQLPIRRRLRGSPAARRGGGRSALRPRRSPEPALWCGSKKFRPGRGRHELGAGTPTRGGDLQVSGPASARPVPRSRAIRFRLPALDRGAQAAVPSLQSS